MNLRLRHLLHVALTVGLLLGWFFFLRPATLGGPAGYLLVRGHSMDGTLAIGRPGGGHRPGRLPGR